MTCCFNKRVVIGLGLVALVLLAFSPRLLGSVAPLLIFAVCPLSMLLMMRVMNRREPGSGPGTCTSKGDHDAQLRELVEEVNRLKAERRLRSQDRPA